MVMLLMMVLGLASAKNIPQQPDMVQKSKIKTLMPLKRGVNLFDWFMGPRIYTMNHQAKYITQDQVRQLRENGLDHVRIPIDPRFLAAVETTDPVFNKRRILALDNALEMLNQQHMAAILVITPERDAKRVATTPEAQETYAKLWKNLAARYKHYSPKQIYFEILGEPHFPSFYPDKAEAERQWLVLQDKLIKGIRSETKEHTIITDVYDWSTVASIVKTNNIYPDPRIIYTAHFYDPMPFTHQGSAYLWQFKPLQQVPYPMTMQTQGECRQKMTVIPEGQRKNFDWYCNTPYDAASVDKALRAFVDWGRQHNVPVYLGEFGVPETSTATTPDIQTWLHDVRVSAEKYNIPWTLWAETPERATLVSPNGKSPNGSRVDLIKSLGLTPKRSASN